MAKYSIIVPAYNEEANLNQLLALLAQELNSDYEVIIVDDGSTDRTYEISLELARKYQFLKVIKHPRNLGKTEAILSGAQQASGDYLVIFDADLQYSPADIPKFINELERGYDMCVGWKQGKYEKKFVSQIYNFLARKLFSLSVHDINAMKAFRKEVLFEISSLRKDWHRYLVPLAHDKGFKITELKVKLYPRYAGQPKYQSPFRIVIGFLDLLAVGFQIRIMRKPMFYLGLLGSLTMLLGVIVGIVAIVLRIFGHGFRPLLYLVILLILAGLLIFGLGFLGEAVAHISERLERIEAQLKDRKK
ncbi:MAG: glycosyltransferase family 2 protein [candidate division WOR-3 bacterium]|nr:glycosyltransferase family 2 protein [candidate division WOR-3 bacterium]MCX7757762.1 glycosyltransferase family 2 protein [candidate division WOR-3 bacterium]MDW7988298.1 glycosyltransferase family 2 protein [candidate division WOR-3 bacterium]